MTSDPFWIFKVPQWVRPGVAMDYKATDGNWYGAKISYLTESDVVLELGDGTHHNVSHRDIGYDGHFRPSGQPNKVTVESFPLTNVRTVGSA